MTLTPSQVTPSQAEVLDDIADDDEFTVYRSLDEIYDKIIRDHQDQQDAAAMAEEDHHWW